MTVSKAVNIKEDVLPREQKQAAAILCIGTCLEYFDLYLYMHMSVILDRVFFPTHYKGFLTTLAASAVFFFRPLGAFIFGWVGDKVGRKSLIFFTASGTAIGCIIIAILPSYSKIGMLAAYLLTACRIFQGVMSMGEIQSTRMYFIESIKSPKYLTYTLLFHEISAHLGGLFAVLAAIYASYVEKTQLIESGWRIVFAMGGVIAFTGLYARSTLQEAKSYIEAKMLAISDSDKKIWDNFEKHTIKFKSAFYYIFLILNAMICLYFVPFLYGTQLLKSIGYSSLEISINNAWVVAYTIFFNIFVAFLSFRINILKIAQAKLIFGIILVLILHLNHNKITTMQHVFLLQIFSVSADAIFLLKPIIFSYFPIMQRSRYVFLCFATASILSASIFTFFKPFLQSYMPSNYATTLLLLPILIFSFAGVRYFSDVSKKQVTSDN